MRYIKIVCDVVFTQMRENKGTKRFGATTLATMVRKFMKLIEGAVPGKPVVISADSNSFTDTEKDKSL